ncbi:TolC family protein [Paludibaculum fermentans]|uniref:TolC family protein n=1 Tax=Paludibaculum fermentans TaxID=1473598 RepID=UPI003EBA9266
MNLIRPILAVFLAALMIAPASLAQAPQAPGTPASSAVNTDFSTFPQAKGRFFLRDYKQADVAPINLQNSSRLEALIRGGKIYLGLDDVIALALENNLDLELQRYTPQLAQADLLRAQAGGLLRGVPTAVSSTSGSAQSQVTGGATGGTSSNTSGSSSTTSSAGGAVITQTGTSIPNLDPSFYFSSQFGHRSSPQSNTVTTGTTALISDSRYWSAGYQQSWLTGTTMSYGWNNTWFKSNNYRSDINPGWNPNMTLQITQNLLQGWGLAVNNRNIRVAKNNIRLSDLTFKQQVMTTVAGIVNLYWDLVSYSEDLKVKKKALEVAQKFYEDNKKQVEIGTLAPIEIVRAEANVAQAQQDLTNSETSLLQQETIVKSALSRTGVASPSLSEARIVPTDTLIQPTIDLTIDLKQLVDTALRERPDVAQTQINIDNTKIGLNGSRNALLPSLQVQATATNNGLAGPANTVPAPAGQDPVVHNVDPFFQGGYSTALSQLFRRNFPDYSIAFSLNVPIRNRTAKADYVRDTLSLRQQEINAQRQINDIRVNVQNAQIAVIQAKARYDSAVKARVLQQQTLDAENKKYALGASTAFLVVQTQRDLAQAQGTEVSALAGYSRARVQLDLATAQILNKYKVEVNEARAGKSSRPITTPQN